MVDAARKAAKQLIRDFGEVAELQVSKKGAADYVSAADLKAEQTLFEELMKARPGYSFLGEERGLIEGTDKTHRWIADPLDGTTNFLHAIPHFAVNLALEREGVIVAAATYNPISDELFWAEKGKGAFLNNDKRLRVAARRDLASSVIASGTPFLGRPGHTRFLKELHQVGQRVAGLRRFGSAALTKSAGPFLETCSSATSPKSRTSLRPALRTAAIITWRRAEAVAMMSGAEGMKFGRGPYPGAPSKARMGKAGSSGVQDRPQAIGDDRGGQSAGDGDAEEPGQPAQGLSDRPHRRSPFPGTASRHRPNTPGSAAA